MRRPDRPFEQPFFRERRPTAGDAQVTIALGPLEVVLGGLDRELAELLYRRYSPHASRLPTQADALHVRLGLEATDYFIDPPPRAEIVPVRLAHDGTRVRYLSYRVAGWFDTDGREGELLLAHGAFEPPERAIENYVRTAVAWCAASRGGALVHAASAVHRERGYLFYGESGAGKSTLAASNLRARIVSDDLSLVLPGPSRALELIGSPFRGTYEGGEPVVGSFPLRAGFRLVQSPTARVESVPRIQGFCEVVGNLPFVAEAYAERPDLLARVERAFAGIPLAHLHFRKDDSYWDAIEAAGY